MKVVNVTRRFTINDWGGTETVVLETTRRARRAGHEVSVYSTTALAENEPCETAVEGVPVRRFPYFYPYFGLSDEAKRKMDQLGGNLFSFSIMQALLKEPKVDLIHLHTAKRLGGIGRTAAMLRHIPYIVSIQGGYLDVPTDEAARLTQPTAGAFEWGRVLGSMVGSRKVYDDASLLICVNPEEMKRLQGAYPNSRIEYLPNGVDLERFASGNGKGFRSKYSIPPDRKVLLCVARIDPQKNQLHLLKHFREIRQQCQAAFLLLIGPSTNDEYASKLRIELLDRDIAEHVIWISGFPPNDPELADAFDAADVFVLPSVHEQFGIVLLEAWAASLPVVASAVGGIPAFVDDGVNGFLVSPTDGPHLTERVVRLLNDEALAKAFGCSGYNKAASQFSWEQITARLLKLYEEVIHAS